MKFIKTYQTKQKIKMFADIHLQFSSEALFFMLKSPIVARRRGCQLATIAPVLLFQQGITSALRVTDCRSPPPIPASYHCSRIYGAR